MSDLWDDIAEIEARNKSMGGKQIWDATLGEIRSAHLDNKTLLAAVRQQRAEIERLSDALQLIADNDVPCEYRTERLTDCGECNNIGYAQHILAGGESA